jgi:hypothetical protein
MRWVVGLGIAIATMPALAGSASPRAVVIATPHDETAKSSEIRWVDVGPAGLRISRTLSVPHAAGAVVRGDVLPGLDAVAVVCDEDGARDPEFGAALFRSETTGLRQLATGLVHASRPLASIDGNLYVERGARGANRIDALTIDSVNPTTGSLRTLHAWSGFALHLAGELGSELIVYRVGVSGAEIIAIDRASGSLRIVAALPAFARDFSIDANRNAIVFSNRNDADAHLWIVERMDLATGARTRLHQETDESPAPFAMPSGDVAWTAARRSGLWISGKSTAPLGAGFDSVRAVTNDGTLALVAHVPSSGFDSAAILDLGSPRTLPLPVDVRIEPIGFVGARQVLR